MVEQVVFCYNILRQLYTLVGRKLLFAVIVGSFTAYPSVLVVLGDFYLYCFYNVIIVYIFTMFNSIVYISLG